MQHFEGFGTSHPDILQPSVKKSIHSFIVERNPSDGLVCIRWKEYMHSLEEHPLATEGPTEGWQLLEIEISSRARASSLMSPQTTASRP